MEQTLLLNASYEPLKIVHWQKAVTLLCQGKVEVIDVYDREIRAVSFSIKLPSVIRLLRYIKIKRRFDYVPFSRANIYARDDHRCQYCGDGYPTSELTFDHVTYGYVISGSLRFEFGPGGEDVVEVEPGGFFVVPANTIHREANPAGDEQILVGVRIGSGPTVFNVDGPLGLSHS